jgi:xylulokinase
MTLLLGIDLGTSSVKAVLFDSETSQTLAVAGEEYPIHKPQPDWAEQNPDDWWQATVRCVRRAVASAGRNNVSAIGFSGHMHGVTLVDTDGKPVRPSIIWADQRTANEVARLIELIGAERHAEVCGTLPAAGFTSPTLMWLAEHEPDALRRAHRLLFPKDYVRLQMTGEAAAELSDAAASGMFDVAGKQWAQDIIDIAHIPTHFLPPVLESSAVAGTLRPTAAEAMGLPAGVTVIMGSADQPAQAVANGLIAPGIASVTVGSGGQVLVPLLPAADGKLRTDARLHVFNHAVPNLFYVLGATLSAGLSLRWLRDLMGMTHDPQAYPTFSRESSIVPPGAQGLLFLPYLTGERTPLMDARARGAFIGLTAAHGRGHLVRAIMEGVAFSMRQALEISLSLGGQAERIIGAGGAMESDVWRPIMTDVIGLPLQKPLLSEQAGVGAALIAGVGAGVYSSFDDAKARVTRYSAPTQPDAARHAFYNERYTQFVALYPTLRDDMHRLS